MRELRIILSLSVLLLGKIILQGMAISQNFDKANKTKFAREQLTTEVRNLKILETQYKNYRDIFFRIAILDYRLGNLTEARTYIKKSLEVDPNFNEGLAFGKKVGI